MGKNNSVLVICGLLVTLWLVLYEHSRRKVGKREGNISFDYKFGSIDQKINATLSLVDNSQFDKDGNRNTDLRDFEINFDMNKLDMNKVDARTTEDGILVVKLEWVNSADRPLLDPKYWKDPTLGFNFQWLKQQQGPYYANVCKEIFKDCDKLVSGMEFELIALRHAPRLPNDYRKLNALYYKSKFNKDDLNLGYIKSFLKYRNRDIAVGRKPQCPPEDNSKIKCDDFIVVYNKYDDRDGVHENADTLIHFQDLIGKTEYYQTLWKDRWIDGVYVLIKKDALKYFIFNSDKDRYDEKKGILDYQHDSFKDFFNYKTNDQKDTLGYFMVLTQDIPQIGRIRDTDKLGHINASTRNKMEEHFEYFMYFSVIETVEKSKSEIATKYQEMREKLPGGCKEPPRGLFEPNTWFNESPPPPSRRDRNREIPTLEGWCIWYKNGIRGLPITGGIDAAVEQAQVFKPVSEYQWVAKCADKNDKLSLVDYAWSAGTWSECSEECGGGERTRSVTCTGSDGSEGADTMCTGQKPAEKQACNTEVDCIWNTGGWSQCTRDCGSGSRTRSVACKTPSGSPAAEEKCKGERPAATEICNTQACESYNWSSGDWGECSAKCGGGVRTRTVTCNKDTDGTIVGDGMCSGTRPNTQEACNTHACPERRTKKYKWELGDWSTCSKSCNGGEQTRTVTCVDDEDKTAVEEMCEGKEPKTRSCNIGVQCPTCTYKEFTCDGTDQTINQLSDLDNIKGTLKLDDSNNKDCVINYDDLKKYYLDNEGQPISSNKFTKTKTSVENVWCNGSDSHTWNYSEKGNGIKCNVKNLESIVINNEEIKCKTGNERYDKEYTENYINDYEKHIPLSLRNIVKKRPLSDGICTDLNDYVECKTIEDCRVFSEYIQVDDPVLYREFYKDGNQDVAGYWNLTNELVMALRTGKGKDKMSYLDYDKLTTRFCLNVKTSRVINPNDIQNDINRCFKYWSQENRDLANIFSESSQRSFLRITKNGKSYTFNNESIAKTMLEDFVEDRTNEIKYVYKEVQGTKTTILKFVEIIKQVDKDCKQCKSLTHYESMPDTLRCMYKRIGSKIDFGDDIDGKKREYWEEHVRCAKAWGFDFSPADTSTGKYSKEACNEILGHDGMSIK